MQPQPGILRNQSVLDEKRARGKGTHFAFLAGCFGDTRIMPTDIDCIIERNGKFLVIEEKRVGEELTTGQRILLENLSKKQGTSIVACWGDSALGDISEYQRCTNGTWGVRTKCTTDEFRNVVKSWFSHANRKTH